MKKNRSFIASTRGVVKKWHLIDATDQVLGKLAVVAAQILRGKNKAIFTPHIDAGDFVIVINASKVRVTGKKKEQKTYFRHSGYPGGHKIFKFDKVIEVNPCRVIKQAVSGMLPKNRLGADLLKKLKVYAGATHPHQAQQPEVLQLERRIGNGNRREKAPQTD